MARRGRRALLIPILAVLVQAAAPAPAEDLFAVVERAGKGHADTQFRMGLIYFEGDIVSKDARRPPAGSASGRAGAHGRWPSWAKAWRRISAPSSTGDTNQSRRPLRQWQRRRAGRRAGLCLDQPRRRTGQRDREKEPDDAAANDDHGRSPRRVGADRPPQGADPGADGGAVAGAGQNFLIPSRPKSLP